MKFDFSLGRSHWAWASALALAACNLFNPNGTGSVDDSDPDASISYAQSLYRSGEYASSMEYYQKAIALDSTKSEAYFGLAKASLRAAGINPMQLLGFIAVDSNQIPFMSEEKSVKNTYYRGMTLVKEALIPLVQRDSLTELWELATNPSAQDTLLPEIRARLDSFTTEHGPEYVGYPLSDRKVKYARFSVDYTLANFISFMLAILDLNHDGYIDDKDVDINLTKDSNGNVTVDVASLYSAALQDSVVARNLNQNIEDLAAGTGDISALVNSLTGTIGSQDSGTSQITSETQAQLDSQINDLGAAVRFYKIGDAIDNDGDGCVDEEIFDSLDNDNDGFVDEDLRLVASNDAPFDQVDNDGDGLVDEPDEALVPGTTVLGFVSAYIPDADGYPSDTTKAEKIAIAEDTLKTIPLATRQARIGGCWGFYNSQRFADYRTKEEN